MHLRAVGENPATADAAGINVEKTKYIATGIGSIIAGLGGLYYVMDYANGVWSNDGFGDRGWLAIALVIFAVWKPNMSILGSIVFGGLYIVYLYVPSALRTQELFKMIPYLVTIFVLILVAIRKEEGGPVLPLWDFRTSVRKDKIILLQRRIFSSCKIIVQRRLLWLILTII